MVAHGVVTPVEKKHLVGHGAGDNLSRHEKMPQIHLIGEFRSHNVGHYGRVDGALLRSKPLSQRLFSFC
jgi:hypothetical protein